MPTSDAVMKADVRGLLVILLLGQPLKWFLVVAPFKPDMIQIVAVNLTEC